MGIAFTAIGALIPEVVSADSRGLAMGGYNSSIYIGMMLSSLVMGTFAGELGFRNCFLIVALANVVTTGLFGHVMRPPPRAAAGAITHHGKEVAREVLGPAEIQPPRPPRMGPTVTRRRRPKGGGMS